MAGRPKSFIENCRRKNRFIKRHLILQPNKHILFYCTIFPFLPHCANTSQNLNMLPTRPQIRGPRKTKTDLEIFENVFFCCCLLRPLYFWINSNITIGGLLFRHTASVFLFFLGQNKSNNNFVILFK